MRRLARDAERLRDLRPRPAFGHSALDRRVLDPVGETPERADGGESFRGIIGQRSWCSNHASTLVDTGSSVNLGCCGHTNRPIRYRRRRARARLLGTRWRAATRAASLAAEERTRSRRRRQHAAHRGERDRQAAAVAARHFAGTRAGHVVGLHRVGRRLNSTRRPVTRAQRQAAAERRAARTHAYRRPMKPSASRCLARRSWLRRRSRTMMARNGPGLNNDRGQRHVTLPISSGSTSPVRSDSRACGRPPSTARGSSGGRSRSTAWSARRSSCHASQPRRTR